MFSSFIAHFTIYVYPLFVEHWVLVDVSQESESGEVERYENPDEAR